MAITKIYKGTNDVTSSFLKAYKGGTEIYTSTPPALPYLTFQSTSNFTLRVYDNTKHWDGTLYYSTDTTTWNVWSGTTTLYSGGNKLYLRGTGNTKITGDSTNYRWVLTGTNIECLGNIENLLDWETVLAGNSPAMATYCYQYIFYGCTSLTTAPTLPATTLAPACYQSMFQGCTSLTTAPTLPATTLAPACYQSMFGGCTLLTTAPALPATTLTGSCYASMFGGCTSLTTAPTLPATTLADYCYSDMFYGCSSLTTAPTLPATTLANACYRSMFYGCTSLTTAPTLPATTLAKYCYKNMFRGCTSLTTVPALPATTLADYCYEYMFYGCTSLKVSSTKTGVYQQTWRIPTSGTGYVGYDWNAQMLSGTGGTFTSNPTINKTYYVENAPV
jgi:hypothetical protein